MNTGKIEMDVEKIVLPIIDENGYELVDVEFVKEDEEWYLRVYIDREEGVTLDDCAKVSRRISDKLDETDPIDCSYYLEVSSPGLNRPLKKEKDFIRFSGRNIKIKLYKALDGRKVFEGTLIGLDNNVITIDVKGEEIKINRELASSVRLNEI